MDNTDTLRTQPGEPDVLLHDKETDIEPAMRNLIGKKLSDTETTDTVWRAPFQPPVPPRFLWPEISEIANVWGIGKTFAREDLPPGTRIIQASGKWATTEHAPSRLTVVVGDDGTVSHVFTG